MENTEIQTLLRQQGLRLTQVRQALIAFVAGQAKPLTANQVLTSLQQQFPSLHKTTVYRELETLTNRNILTTVDFGDGLKRFEQTGEHHHHIVCNDCQSIQDIPIDQDICRSQEQLAKRHGFQKIQHSFEFFGLCSRCSTT